MLEAMMIAPVGDDVFGDDPTVNALQEKIAKQFGMEDALFCPSGTMTNQIAMRINTRPQDEVVCHQFSHVYMYEGGGMVYNSMISPKLLNGERGRITANQVKQSINPDDIHYPRTQLVVLENTMNKGGGSVYDFSEIEAISKVCKEHQLRLHLDGARLFNAIKKSEDKAPGYGKLFDTISVCFSKGLGAPVGSVLIGSKHLIKEAKRVRKVFGGAMRQAGYLAAACIYALDHHIDRLTEDHERAKSIGAMLTDMPFIKEIFPVDTNIVIAKIDDSLSESWFLEELKKQDILAVPFGSGLVRFVTHLDFTDDHLTLFEKGIKKIVV